MIKEIGRCILVLLGGALGAVIFFAALLFVTAREDLRRQRFHL